MRNVRKVFSALVLQVFLLVACGKSFALDILDPATFELTIPLVTVGNTVFTNVRATISRVNGFSLTPPPLFTHDVYDPASNELLISSVVFNGITYYNVRVEIDRNRPINIGGNQPVSSTNPLLRVEDPLPPATVGVAYSRNVVTGVTPNSNYTFMIDTLANGVLPTGMTLHMDGTLSGTPFATGRADVQGNQIANTYRFGVCAVDTLTRAASHPCPQTTIVVNPAKPAATLAPTLTGSWSGSWNWSGTGSSGCKTTDVGTMSVTLTQSVGTASGSNVSASGVETRWDDDCSLIAVQTATGGSMTLTASGTGYNVQFVIRVGLPNNGTLTLSFSGTATLENDVLTANYVRTTGGSGSFVLRRQR